MSLIYPIPRPKILTPIVVPTAGWAVVVEFSHNATGQYAEDVTVTIPAGTYFMRWDGQSDDFLWKFNSVLCAGITANATLGGGGATWAGFETIAYINSDNKVVLSFDGSSFDSGVAAGGGTQADVRIDWTATTGSIAIAKVLGFDETQTQTTTATSHPELTADYQHGYAWYADADGQLEFLSIENEPHNLALQSVAPTGEVITHRYGGHYTAEMRLSFLPRERVYSGAVNYGEAVDRAYDRNAALECWWREVRDGTRFCVYRNGHTDPNKAIDNGPITGSTTTTLTSGAKAWTPDEWIGRLVYGYLFSSGGLTTNDVCVRRYITDNTATVLTFNATIGEWANNFKFHFLTSASSRDFVILDHTYDTYVIDTSRMRSFSPVDMSPSPPDRFSITIPLRKYV